VGKGAQWSSQGKGDGFFFFLRGPLSREKKRGVISTPDSRGEGETLARAEDPSIRSAG